MENKERNSNVILLIVIAIATMVIVVIGATFAYLASTATANSTANLNAGFQEGERDLLLIDAGKDLSVEATYDNFGKGEGDQSDYDIAKVVLQAASDSSSSYNYDVYLETESNDMVYTAGTCYKKTASVVTLNDDRASCTGGNAWAKVSGSDTAACYEPATEKVESAIGESERACLTSTNNMWVMDEDVAELAFDIYRPVSGVTTETACTANPTDTPDTNLGVCLDKQRNVNNTITKASECTAAGYSWTPNYFDNESNSCFKVVKSVDITTAQAGEIKVFENVEISATDGATVTQNYRVGVTLINLSHNQIANSGHKYVGRLNIKVNQPETPATGGEETPGA